MKRRRIIIVVDYAHTKGGAERVAWLSAIGLAERGHDVTVLCAVGPVNAEQESIPNLRIVCLEQRDLLSNKARFSAAMQGIWNKPAQLAMRQLLAGTAPGEVIVHGHSWTHALSSAPLSEAIQHQAAVILTVHDYFTACPNGGFYDFQAGEVCERKPLSLSCLCTNCDARSRVHKMFRVVRQFVQRDWAKVPSRIHHFITISDLNRRINAPYMPADSKFYHLDNPFDFERTEPALPALNQTVVFVGRLVPEKAPHHLAMATAKLSMPVTFVGDGPLAGEIRRLNPAAKITGWLSAEQVTQELRNARVLVLPSVWYEGQPLSTLEATAQGIPIIVSSSCAAREQVTEGVNGFVFPGGKPEELERVLARMVDDELVARLGRGAWEQFWNSPFALTEHLVRLEKIYTQMLGEEDMVSELLMPTQTRMTP